MKKTTVYDLPTRLFHWLFAFLFIAAFLIAEYVDDDSALFSYHMLAGLTMVFLLVLRIIWGFMGTTYARFNTFILNPAELFRYLKKAVTSNTKRFLGHGPASSWAAVIMFFCALGLAVTGIAMGRGGGEFYEEIHEFLAEVFLFTVIAHLAGILFHHFRHRDSLWSSMLDGKKKAITGEKGISTTRPVAGILFIAITISWFIYLNNRYDRAERTLDLFGIELPMEEEDHEYRSSLEGINPENGEIKSLRQLELDE